jgi:hypothetical protein
VSFVKPTVKSGSRGVQQNLFYNFLDTPTSFYEFLKFKLLSVGPQTGTRPAARVRKRPAAAACHTRSADKPAGPWPGGPVQPRRQLVMRGNGASAVRLRRGHRAQPRAHWRDDALAAVWWGLAGGKVLPASIGGVSGWHRAGGVEAGLTLAVARRAGVERRRRRRGGGRRWGRGGSGERRSGPVARGGGEGGGCGAASERRGEIAARWRKTQPAAVGFPF